MEYSPGTPFASTSLNSTSSATGQTAPTSSSRLRRSSQPAGRGFALSSARTASISAIVFLLEAAKSSLSNAELSAFVSARTLAFCALNLQVRNYLQLNVSLLYWILVAPFTGQFFKIAPIFRQMVFIGVRAAPMVALTAFSVGVTLAMQAAHSLEQLGADMYVPDLVMVTLLREMGPVLIAVIVIGRSGSGNDEGVRGDRGAGSNGD